jgi:hypothetical protein
VRGLIAGFVCVVFACLPAGALASVRADDAAATRAYLGAAVAYERSAYAEVGASVASIEGRASEIGGECPSVLTYAPRDVVFGELGEEVGTTLFYAGVAPMRATRLGFARAVGQLSWSDHRLTRLVRAGAVEEVAVATVALPDVCADIEAWKASAYAALPRSAAGFLARVAAIESLSVVGQSEESREMVIMRLLKRYEGLSERRTVKRLKRQEQTTDRKLGAAAEAARAKLAARLGVSAL